MRRDESNRRSASFDPARSRSYVETGPCARRGAMVMLDCVVSDIAVCLLDRRGGILPVPDYDLGAYGVFARMKGRRPVALLVARLAPYFARFWASSASR